MLSLPSKGFARSINRHNVDLNICCDWVEASALFDAAQVSKSDIVDVLRENEIYETQDFAFEFTEDIFNSLLDRFRVAGSNYPFKVEQSRLFRISTWEDYAPYAFCLTAALRPLYPDWARSFGHDHQVQGQLFESLTAEAMKAQYAGWVVLETGWSRLSHNLIATVATRVAEALGETIGDVSAWTTEETKEAGLDILCFRPYLDSRPGYPSFLVQCASGDDWKRKLKTPDLRIWTKVVSFPNDPKKALSMPFVLSAKDFRRNCNLLNGLLLDRLRLLSHQSSALNWLEPTTDASLKTWIRGRIATLPLLEAA